AYTIALASGRIEQCHVGNVDRHCFVNDAAGIVVHRIMFSVFFDDVYAFNQDVISVNTGQHDTAALFITTGKDDNLVTFTNVFHLSAPYSTSGASDTIFMKSSVRSSRVTGPKIRVPIGSSLAFSSTAALPPKRISEPSLRRTPLAVRTTTAL